MPKLEYITLYTCILYIIYGYNVFYLTYYTQIHVNKLIFYIFVA